MKLGSTARSICQIFKDFDSRVTRVDKDDLTITDQIACFFSYTKLGKSSNFTVGSIDDVDILITDSFADPKLIAKFEKNGIQVIQVPI